MFLVSKLKWVLEFVLSIPLQIVLEKEEITLTQVKFSDALRNSN